MQQSYCIRYRLELIKDSISSTSGMTQSAPLRVVISAAAAFAKVSISIRRSSFKLSKPYFRTKWSVRRECEQNSVS